MFPVEVFHTTFDWPSDPLVQLRLVKPEDFSEQEVSKKLLEYHRNFPEIFHIYQKVLKSINADQPCVDVLSQGKFVLCGKWSRSCLRASSWLLESLCRIRQHRWLPAELCSPWSSIWAALGYSFTGVSADNCKLSAHSPAKEELTQWSKCHHHFCECLF